MRANKQTDLHRISSRDRHRPRIHRHATNSNTLKKKDRVRGNKSELDYFAADDVEGRKSERKQRGEETVRPSVVRIDSMDNTTDDVQTTKT